MLRHTHIFSHERDVLSSPLMILDSPVMDLCIFFPLLVFSYISIIYIKTRPRGPNLFGMGTCFVEDNFSMDPGLGVEEGEGEDSSGIKVSDGEPWGAADEAPLLPQLLTTCCAAGFLIGHGPILVVQGLGIPGQDYNTHLSL